MKKSKNVMFFVLIGLLASCSKNIETNKENVTTNKNVTTMNELIAPANFNWQMSREVTFNVSVSDSKFQDAIHMISIYDANPVLGGKLLSRGSASLTKSFISKVNLSNTIKKVFIQNTAPDNSIFDQEIAVNFTNISIDLGAVKLGKTFLGKTASPDCNSGCTQTITSNNTNINVSSGNVICVTGSNITVGFNANGGTIRICGSNVTVQNANLNSGTALIVTSSGSATFSNLNMNGSSSTLENWGTIRINNSFSPGGAVTNNGNITTTGDYSLNTQSSTTNNGTINVNQSVNIDGNTTLSNNGTFNVTQSFQVNGTGVFVNNCKLIVGNDYQNNGTTRNYSYISVGDETQVNGGSELGMYNGAMFKTYDITINGDVKGYVATSLVKVIHNTRINGGGKVLNYIQYCDANGIETNNGTIGSGATQGCSLYIPTTACNPEGNNGSSMVTDTDGDGVADNIDEYPTDATKAYNNYYPSVGDYATLAFEDMWPSKGDYDMNDVVMKYKYNVITNAGNDVVQVVGNYTLVANGASFENGFGVEFPILRSKATSLTGGTLESGQTKAVVTLFNNTRREMDMWNTIPGTPTSNTVNYTISFNVSAGTSLSSFGLGSYNPFIWNNTSGYGRGYEIHLPYKTPTSLANTALFGTINDNSSGANTYISKENNLPWAIDVPVTFNYPIERADITTAHLKFASWVQSGGTQYQDWYSNQTGYRNAAKIY